MSPGVQVNAVTTWYYANCTTILGVGSYSVDVAPKHGTVTFGEVSGPLPGCPPGSPSLPAVAAYYTWTDESTLEITDYFQLTYSVNGLTELIDVTVNLTAPPSTEPCNQILTSQTIATVPRQPNSRTTVGVAEVVQLNTTYPADWFIDGNGILSEPSNGTCSLSTSATPVHGTEACFTAPYSKSQDTITAALEDGRSCSIQLNTIEPSGVIYQRLTAPGYEFKDPQHPGMGFWAAFFVVPADVSFKNVGIAEEDVAPDQRFTTTPSSLVFTIPAQGVSPNPTFPATNATLVGCDKDYLDFNTHEFFPYHSVPFPVVYTWGTTPPDYLDAQKKQFAMVETELTYPLFFWFFQKGQVQLGFPINTYVEPTAFLLVSEFSKPRSMPQDISGSCYGYVESQFPMVPMSQ